MKRTRYFCTALGAGKCEKSDTVDVRGVKLFIIMGRGAAETIKG